MANFVNMPKLSDTMEEGGIAQWFKKEGDSVKEGDLLVAIETDKAAMEYPSPESGVLLKILVEPGKAVALQTPIAIIGAKGEDISALLSSGPQKAKTPAAAAAATPAQKPVERSPEKRESGGRIKASPLAKKIAVSEGINLNSITGSGPGGRIVSRDLHAGEKAAPKTAAVSMANRADQRIPHTMMRKTIAKRLLAGKNDAPHFYLTTTIDMSQAQTWREQINAGEDVAAKKTPKISINDIVCFATSRALRSHPLLNASWQEDAILLHGSVHLAIAVALESGLVTPVVQNADMLGLKDLARRIRELVDLAKTQKLKPEDYSTGTFTVSNLGMTVVDHFTAIINPPQAAILAVGRIQNQVTVDAKGAFVAKPMMQVTLSCDHRVVDGMVGAQFLKTLSEFLENPLLMLG